MNFKEKLVRYLKCDESYDWLIPPTIFYLFSIFATLFIVIFSFGGEDKTVNHLNLEIPADTTVYHVNHVEIEKKEDFVMSKSKYWSSKETKFPVGIVIGLDYAHGKDNLSSNYYDNYITIKKTNGMLKIIRDVDVDLFLNLKIGDTIR